MFRLTKNCKYIKPKGMYNKSAVCFLRVQPFRFPHIFNQFTNLITADTLRLSDSQFELRVNEQNPQQNIYYFCCGTCW